MKVGLRYVSPFVFVLHRFALSTIALLPFFLFWRNKLPRDRLTLTRLVILCLLFVGVITAQVYGLAGERSGVGAVLVYTQPIFVFCLAVPFLGESVTKSRLFGVSLGFAGVVVLSANKVGSFTVDSTLVLLLSAFLWAMSVIFYKKSLSHVSPLIAQFFQLSLGIIPLMLLSLTENTPIIQLDPSYVGILLFSSVAALALADVIWLFLLKEEEATTIAGSSFLVPVAAMFFGWQLLGESLTAELLLGSALTLGGVYILNRAGKKKSVKS